MNGPDAEFIQEYSNLLRELQRPEKAQINTLSMLADDNKQAAPAIVNSIEKHILSCPPPWRLPALYLMDSIIKNVKEPYKSLFSKRLPEVFGAVWESTLPKDRASLSKLYNTWSGVLPPHVLALVQSKMSSSAQNGHRAAVSAPLPPVQQPVQQHQHRQAVPSVGVQLQQQTILQPMPVPQHSILQPQQQGGLLGLHVQQPIQFLAHSGLPMVSLAPQPPIQQPVFMQVGNQLIQVTAPQPALLSASVPPLQQQQQPMPANVTPQHVMQVAGLPPVSPAHPGWQQQQQAPAPRPMQQQQQVLVMGPGAAGPMLRRSPASPPAAAQASPMHSGSSPPQPRRASQRSASPAAATQVQMTNDALSNLLANLTKSGLLVDDAALKTKTFSAPFLKELHSGVLRQLEQDSARTRAVFRDVEFRRNKRRKANEGGAVGVSRSWYLPVDTWIAGTTLTTAEDVAATNPFGDDESSEGKSDEEEVPLEPEDPSQTECAISGEPFDKFFDEDAEGWFYRGVKRISGAEAQHYGVPDGSLVKVKCLAEAALGSGAAALATAAAAAAVAGCDEADLAAAAAAATDAAEGGQPSTSAAAAAAATTAATAAAEDGDLAEQKASLLSHIKQEELQLIGGVKQEVQEEDHKPPPEAAAAATTAATAAAERVGAKREAADTLEQTAAEGSPAKKRRVSNE